MLARSLYTAHQSNLTLVEHFDWIITAVHHCGTFSDGLCCVTLGQHVIEVAHVPDDQIVSSSHWQYLHMAAACRCVGQCRGVC